MIEAYTEMERYTEVAISMENDIILNKIQSIERCINRIRQVYDNNPANLADYTKQDSIILNVERACETCIDIAMNIVSQKKLGIPQSRADSFQILCDFGIIDQDLADRMKAMVGFRNRAIHDYQTLNLEIVQRIIEEDLDDFLEFASTTMKLLDQQ